MIILEITPTQQQIIHSTLEFITEEVNFFTMSEQKQLNDLKKILKPVLYYDDPFILIK